MLCRLSAQAVVAAILLTAGAAQAGPLFQDDFQLPKGWPVTNPNKPAEGALFAYLTDGSYQITPLRTGGWAIATAPTSGYGPDVRAGVDVFLAGANPASVVGLACRVQDGRNFYGLVIGVAQGWGIFRMVDGVVTPLDKGPLGIDTIRSQRVEAECSGRSLALTVNGRRLAEVTDSTFARGQVGLLVAASRSASVSGAFDNFALYAAGASDAQAVPQDQRRTVERRMPAPVGGPALRPNEALVTVAYGSFRYEAVIAWKGEARLISGQVSSPLGRHDAIVSPGGNGYTVVLRSSPNYSAGIAGWTIDVDAFTGRARCARSPLYDGALGRMSVANAEGRFVCEL